MFRNFEGTVDNNGNGSITIQQHNTAMEWDIYQMSVQCGAPFATCIVSLFVNGIFLCGTPQGSGDTATGPPDTVISSSDILTASWTNGVPGDVISVGVWYNENPVGTTFSTAH